MSQLTPAGNSAVSELSQRYGFSVDAVCTLLSAVAAGGGTMAQFHHPEFGGGGQWMRGGMTMVGDMFNSGLQSRVSGLCSELSNLLASTQVYPPVAAVPGNAQGQSQWWPAELGSPSSTGGQNNSRYAYFPSTRRLAVDDGGKLSVYDTLDHQIGGVQQQQGGPWGSLTFSSQFGTFGVDSLPRVNGGTAEGAGSRITEPMPAQSQAPVSATTEYFPEPPQAASYPPPFAPAFQATAAKGDHGIQSSRDVLEAIERLGQLFSQGLLTNDEFQSKKAELLSRL